MEPSQKNGRTEVAVQMEVDGIALTLDYGLFHLRSLTHMMCTVDGWVYLVE